MDGIEASAGGEGPKDIDSKRDKTNGSRWLLFALL